MDLTEKWDRLLELGVTNQTLTYITNINGYRSDVLDDILYVHTGYLSFDQIED